MSSLPIHSIDTAPEGSRETLRHVRETVGLIPNLAGAMAESPTLLRGFFTLREIYAQGTLTPAEIHVLSLANAVENDCAWCVAFHSVAALKEGVPADAVTALRDAESPNDARLAALVELTRSLIRNRGRAGARELGAFQAAGFTAAQALEVVLGIAFSTMANYTGHFADAPLEPMLTPHAWTRPVAA
jgi:AhpD family alkylhydroperoxidase